MYYVRNIFYPRLQEISYCVLLLKVGNDVKPLTGTGYSDSGSSYGYELLSAPTNHNGNREKRNDLKKDRQDHRHELSFMEADSSSNLLNPGKLCIISLFILHKFSFLCCEKIYRYSIV